MVIISHQSETVEPLSNEIGTPLRHSFPRGQFWHGLSNRDPLSPLSPRTVLAWIKSQGHLSPRTVLAWVKSLGPPSPRRVLAWIKSLGPPSPQGEGLHGLSRWEPPLPKRVLAWIISHSPQGQFLHGSSHSPQGQFLHGLSHWDPPLPKESSCMD